MHDAVYLERHGIPTVTIAEDAFITAARKQAAYMGIPDLPFVVVTQARSWETDADIRAKVLKAVEEIRHKFLAPGRRVRAPA